MLAKARGWLPLAPTGVLRWREAHPAWDGRGVLIGILDTGIDAGIAGLDSTSTGRPKLLDLRDFSGEGTLALAPLSSRGDTAALAGQRLTGMSRVRGVTSGPWFAGVLRERSLGQPPASDVNGNGSAADTLMIVVGRGSDGWVLYADTDGDGSLANERPVRDYREAGDTFGWHRPGEPTPLTIAVNLNPPAANQPANRQPPTVALFFDTEAHGTHVAGIAAGRSIGGIPGFDGVAPGAQLLGLKISRNDLGGITTTGSVIAAMDYAIRLATARRMPLVLNLSFGVGNEREGAARLDRIIDSVLLRNPEVVFVTSAGNDGPGLSTLGFPGSAAHALTVGGTQAAAFLPALPPPRVTDPLLYFSSRGGELAKPDLVAPGTAYSTVPRWNLGEEFKSGTSMASPQVAGLAALLLSAVLEQRKTVPAGAIRHALTGSGRTLPGQTPLDGGAGLPDVGTAWNILQQPFAGVFELAVEGRPGATAAFAVGTGDSAVTFRVTRSGATTPAPREITLASDASWLTAPARMSFDQPTLSITLRQTPPREPGTYVGTVRATAPGITGPLFSLLSTVVVPVRASPHAAPVEARLQVAPGAEQRVAFAVEAGRAFSVAVESGGRSESLIAALHQPGGQPMFGGYAVPAGADTLAASFEVDGADARPGFWELVAAAAPDASATARVSIRAAPVLLALESPAPDSVVINLRSASDSLAVGRLRFGLLGSERSVTVDTAGSAEVAVPVRIPSWAHELIADLELDPGQWPHWSDFGFAAVDETGAVLEKEPANYARTRLTLTLPDRSGEQTIRLILAPGFADAGSRERWTARVRIRLLAAQPEVLTAAEGDTFQLPPRGSTRFHARLGTLPWVLPEGSVPLLLFIVESLGSAWTWQLPLKR